MNMSELIVKRKPKSPVSEAYRAIRTNIQFANVDGNLKTILVTSSTPGEGKTTTLSNIALTMADAGHKILIIDCDMRKPRVHRVFGLSNAYGLSDELLSKDWNDEAIYAAVYPNLDVLTSGKIPGNPSELLMSHSFMEYLDFLKPKYDYILIDTPPVIPVTDACVLSKITDGVILVCSAHGVERSVAADAKAALAQVGANIIGVVLNRLNIKELKNYSYYYYYGSEDKKKRRGKK